MVVVVYLVAVGSMLPWHNFTLPLHNFTLNFNLTLYQSIFSRDAPQGYRNLWYTMSLWKPVVLAKGSHTNDLKL